MAKIYYGDENRKLRFQTTPNKHSKYTQKTQRKTQLTMSPNDASGLVSLTLVRFACEYRKKALMARFGLLGSFLEGRERDDESKGIHRGPR